MNLTLPKLREMIFEEVERLFLKEKLDAREQSRLNTLKNKKQDDDLDKGDKEEIEGLEHQ